MKAVRLAIFVIIVLSCSLTNVLGSVITAAPVKVEIQRLRWKSKTVKIAVSTSLTRASSNIKIDSDVMGALRRSVQAWSGVADVDLELEYSDRQNVSPSGPAGDGISLITIAQTPENVLFFARDSETASAKTRVFFNRKGVLTEADVVLNPFQQFSTDGTFGTFDLESTLTHEIGHLLGLRHSGVWGSTMADSFAKNGTMGLVDFGPRTLAATDVAAIRELYGPPVDDEACCGVISGKLLTTGGRPGKGLQVWAEETGSGRVVAEADSGPDGVFRMGGMPDGNYSVYWKAKDASAASSMGDLGDVRVEGGENKILNGKIAVRPIDFSVQYLGLNGQLAELGIPLVGGRSYVVNLGGRSLDAGSVNIGFSTPLIRIPPSPLTSQEFGEGISGISFMIAVDPDIPAGQYSVFVKSENGSRACLIGAINIE